MQMCFGKNLGGVILFHLGQGHKLIKLLHFLFGHVCICNPSAMFSQCFPEKIGSIGFL